MKYQTKKKSFNSQYGFFCIKYYFHIIYSYNHPSLRLNPLPYIILLTSVQFNIIHAIYMHSSYTNIDQQYTALWIIKTCITSWTGVTCVIISGNCAWQYSTSSPFNLFLVQFTCIILQYSPLRRTWNANLIKANKWRMITGLVYVYIVTYSMHFIQNDVMTTIVLFLVSLHVCYSNDWTINNLFSKFFLHTMHINIIL